VACVAQVVNIISWLQTRSDGLLKYASFYPFKLMANIAKGKSLDAYVRAPLTETKQFGDVPVLDVSASYDEASQTTGIFIVNRSLTDAMTTDINLQGATATTVQEAWQLAGTDPDLMNTWEKPNASAAKAIKAPAITDGKLRIKLPALSYTALKLG